MLQRVKFDKDGKALLGRGKTVHFMGQLVDIPETLVYVEKEEGGGYLPMFINLTEEEIKERLTALLKEGHKFEFSSLLLPSGRNFAPILYPDDSKDGFFSNEWIGRYARNYERLEYQRREGIWDELENSYKLIELQEV